MQSTLIFPATEQRLGLYPVVDSVDWIEKLLLWGVRTLQLRIKNPEQPDLEAQIIRAIELGKQYQARLFINDYWQLAIQHGAYGVHLGQEDLETTDLNAIHQAGLRLGISTHDPKELDQALNIRPSYVALGHIFPTQTKVMPSKPQGLANLVEAVLQSGDMPSVAIGGISEDRVDAVLATGVGSIALVSAITKAQDPEAVTKRLLAKIEGISGDR